MKHLKFLVKINNVIGYVLIATIVLSPIGFIQVLLGHLILLMMNEDDAKFHSNKSIFKPKAT